MSDDYLKTFLEFLKLAPRYLISLGLIAALLIFVPDKWLKLLSVYDFAQHYRSWLAMLLIISGVLFTVDRSEKISHWMRNRIQARKIKKRQLQRLNSLTEDEKQILRFYLAKETRTNYLSLDDGVVQGLVSAGIIYRNATIGNPLEFAHNIAEFAWEYLHENEAILDGMTNLMRTDKREKRW